MILNPYSYFSEEVEELANERGRVIILKELATLYAKYAKDFWHWGDGEGGSVRDIIEEAFSEEGLNRLTINELQKAWSQKSQANKLVNKIMERDAYRCQICGDWHDLTIDHIIPRSKGGETIESNLQVLCRECNSRKGNR